MFNGFDLSTIQDAKFGNSQVSSIYYGANLIWPTTPPPHDYSQDYLTFESLEDNNAISFTTTDSSFTKTISVSTDNGSTWTQYTSTVSPGTTLATLNTGDKLLVKGDNAMYAANAVSTHTKFEATKLFDAYGNINSLIFDDDYILYVGQENIRERAYGNLFNGCANLVNAEHLILSAQSISQECYYQMFQNCTSLITPPQLPTVTVMQIYCYRGMFSGCTSLTTAPELPATTLSDGCYTNMFYNCTSLTTAPELPATTLINMCYNNMFRGCTLLNNIKMLATDVSASYCLTNWTQNVAATGTFTKKSSTTIPTGDSGIPSGWTVINI